MNGIDKKIKYETKETNGDVHIGKRWLFEGFAA
jgi:hypothetical protein